MGRFYYSTNMWVQIGVEVNLALWRQHQDPKWHLCRTRRPSNVPATRSPIVILVQFLRENENTLSTFLSVLLDCPVAPLHFESHIKFIFDVVVCGMSGIAKACENDEWKSSLWSFSVCVYGNLAFSVLKGRISPFKYNEYLLLLEKKYIMAR